MSSPDSANADGQLHLALARRRQDVQVGPGCRATRGQGHDLPRRGRHRARGRPGRAPLLQRPDARQLQRRTFRRLRAERSRATTPGSPTRSSIAGGTRSTETRRRAARSTSRTTRCSPATSVREHAAEQHTRHVSLAGRGCRRDGRARVRPANHITRPARATKGSWATTRSARRHEDGAARSDAAQGGQARYVIHDDGSLSKIRIARCFPVPFGLPIPNVVIRAA